MRRRNALYGIGSIGVGALVGCGQGNPAAPVETPTPPATEPGYTLVGAGDIGWSGLPGAELTANLLDGIGGTVITLGDHAYPNGSAEDFTRSYDPYWGRHKWRTRPAPGNHEYQSHRARPYFEYFGASAGPDERGWYSFAAGSWLVLSLNSEVATGPGSPQYAWVRSQLTANRASGTLAYFHRPRFSSGRNGSSDDLVALWDLLHEHRVDVVLNGHDHGYERFSRQSARGVPDTTAPRQFIVGTGGAELYPERRSGVAGSERHITGQCGVLKVDLYDGSFTWQFIDVRGTVLDSGREAYLPK